MREYHRSRAALKASVLPSLKALAIAQGQRDTPELDALIESKLEVDLAEFEGHAVQREKVNSFILSFFRYGAGIVQSALGSILYTAFVVAAAFLLAGTSIDFVGLVITKYQAQAAERQAKRSDATPSPTPTPGTKP